MKRYYLAYGSNLNVQQMRFRCPTARVIGTAVIEDYELMMFMAKTSDNQFEVRVYKNSAENKYEPKLSDEALSYEENDKYISLYFDNFYAARRFLDYIPYSHRELRERPARKCSYENSIKYDNDICAISCR